MIYTSGTFAENMNGIELILVYEKCDMHNCKECFLDSAGCKGSCWCSSHTDLQPAMLMVCLEHGMLTFTAVYRVISDLHHPSTLHFQARAIQQTDKI